MRKFYLILSRSLPVLLCFLASQAFAQSRTVTGTITSSDDGSALPGASILEKGTTNGTVTDSKGNFSITVKENSTLILSFIGYKSQEIEVVAQTTLSVNLVPDAATLNEVLVIGYGTVKKTDATGSVVSVDSKAFNKGVVNSAQELLAGKTAGVVVTSNSGAPGNTSTIRIRGGASLNASNDPLIIIDGMPVSNDNLGGSPNILSTINPSDIESFTVLKDASATAIYGLRASNGVILITTKRGGKAFKINYNTTATIATAPRKVEVFNADEYRALIQEYYPEQASLLTDSNTDWQDEIYNEGAFSQDHNLTLTGTTLKTPFRVSLGYNNSDGILKTYNYERASGSLGIDPTFFDNKLKVNINVKGSINDNNFADQSAIGGAIGYDPTKPVFNGNTRWKGYTTWTNGDINGDPNTLAPANPVARLDLTDNTSRVKRSIGNIKLDYELPLIKNLHAVLNLGYDYTETKGHNNVQDSTQWIIDPPGGGQRTEYSNMAKNQLLDFYMTYNPNLKSDDHKLEIMGGYSWSHFYRNRYNPTTNYYGEGTVKNPNPEPSEYFLISLFGRLNYTFKNKYIFTATVRDDGTSRFSSDHNHGIFPSLALAWKIKEEGFLKGSQTISDLKLRVGYGKTGQQDVFFNDYPYLATYTLSDDASSYQLGSAFYKTLRPNKFNKDIKWETSETYNLGLDFGFLENKVTGSLDVYQKKAIDLIVDSRTAKGTNFGSQVLSNIGNVTNKGVELNINAEIISTDNVQWVVGYNVAYNTNKVTKITASDDPDYFVFAGANLGCTTCGDIQAQKVGNPRNAFIVYQQVYDNEGKPVQDAFVDRNNDGIITEGDRYIYKKPDPTVAMGINSRLNYKNFDFSFSGRANFGNYVYNGIASGSTYSSLYSVNALYNTTTHATETDFFNASLERFSDLYIENASFFRMDNINFGYTFDNIYKDRGMIRVGAGVQNVFVITKYSGIDPEIQGGLDNNFYPRTRSFFLSLNAQF